MCNRLSVEHRSLPCTPSNLTQTQRYLSIFPVQSATSVHPIYQNFVLTTRKANSMNFTLSFSFMLPGCVKMTSCMRCGKLFMLVVPDTTRSFSGVSGCLGCSPNALFLEPTVPVTLLDARTLLPHIAWAASFTTKVAFLFPNIFFAHTPLIVTPFVKWNCEKAK